MARTAVLGLPRIGPNRELKFALEAHWAGRTGSAELEETARALRAANWERARAAGIDVIPSGDFSLYDHVLDTAWALGAVDRDAGYFALARGTASRKPLELTKWLDTNYHYLVPELERDRPFELDASHWTGPLREAAALGIATRPVVLGPFSFLALSKGATALARGARAGLRAAAAGAARGRRDRGPARRAVPRARPHRAGAGRGRRRVDGARARAPVELCLATYFAPADPRVFALGADEVHVDLVRAPEQLKPALSTTGRLSLGVLDGRNVWAADLDRALDRIDAAVAALGSERVTIAPSCSLLHVPFEAARETSIEVRPWLAFAVEKLAELGVLKAALDGDRDTLLEPAREVISARRTSALTNDPDGPAARAGRLRRATRRSRSGARRSGRATRCRSCRRRRSAPSRRRPRSARRARSRTTSASWSARSPR